MSSLPTSPVDPSRTRKVRVFVVAAKGLVHHGLFHKPSPVAVVAVDGEEVLCTNVVKGSCDPYWDVHCDILATKDSVVTIKVRDHRNFKPRDPDNSAASLGTVSIRIGDVLDLADDSEQHRMLEKLKLKPLHEEHDVRGRLNVHMRALAQRSSPTPHTPSTIEGPMNSRNTSPFTLPSPSLHGRDRSGSGGSPYLYRSPARAPADLGLTNVDIPPYDLGPALGGATPPSAGSQGAPWNNNRLYVGRTTTDPQSRSGSGGSFDDVYDTGAEHPPRAPDSSFVHLTSHSAPVLHLTAPSTTDLADPPPYETVQSHSQWPQVWGQQQWQQVMGPATGAHGASTPNLATHLRASRSAAPPLSSTRARYPPPEERGDAGEEPGIPANTRLRVKCYDGRHKDVVVISSDVHDFGATAHILRGQVQDNRRSVVALKVFRGAMDPSDLMSLHRELEACSRLIHPHILPFIGTATFRLHTILLSPFMANGNLDTYLQMHEQADRAMLVLQVAEAVRFLHEVARRVHGDLKCQNVLVDDNGNARLADFGLTTTVDKAENDPTTVTAIRQQNTLRFAAPELLTEGEDGTSSAPTKLRSKTVQSDVYAFGMLILQAYSGELPYRGFNHYGVLLEILHGRPPPRPEPNIAARGFTSRHWELCLDCWAQEPASRPDMRQVVTRLNGFRKR